MLINFVVLWLDFWSAGQSISTIWGIGINLSGSQIGLWPASQDWPANLRSAQINLKLHKLFWQASLRSAQIAQIDSTATGQYDIRPDWYILPRLAGRTLWDPYRITKIDQQVYLHWLAWQFEFCPYHIDIAQIGWPTNLRFVQIGIDSLAGQRPIWDPPKMARIA